MIAGETTRQDAVTLLRAVDVMLGDPANWGRYRASYVDGRGHRRRCLVGALRDARRELGVGLLAHMRAKWAIRKAARTIAVRGFNDKRSTTVKDVRRVVKEALAREQSWTMREAARGLPGLAEIAEIDLRDPAEERADLRQVWVPKPARHRAGDTA